LGFFPKTFSFAKTLTKVAHLNSRLFHDRPQKWKSPKRVHLKTHLGCSGKLTREPLSPTQARTSWNLKKRRIFIAKSPVGLRIIQHSRINKYRVAQDAPGHHWKIRSNPRPMNSNPPRIAITRPTRTAARPSSPHPFWSSA